MNAQDANLIISAASHTQFPNLNKKEVLLVGKSNVGKSTLINALTNRKNLAYVGNRPGKTRLINFYDINQNLMLVDVPGYGYANRSHKEQLEYAKLMDSYFELRDPSLMLILIDIRRGLSEEDQMMIDFAEFNEINSAIILSKADKLSRSKAIQEKRKLETKTGLDVYLFSNLDKVHTEPIKKYIKSQI
ncbi:MAG TPA: ribosome biogenesis GTP-binding protein YihA/YsxC [Erysipelothrix sp.]|nr:ribosome biogenesis GTP-binding protein YihA/YsxC [Erysipelothrix sp.]